MSWTQADLDELDKAIATGVTEVQYSDRRVRYRSLNEMTRIRNMIARELGKTQKPRRTTPVHDRGF